MKLFISYRSSNSDQVDAIVNRLRSLKEVDGSPRYDVVWLDKDSIPAGQDWWVAIVNAIIECDVFIFMVSREAVQSINCLAELSYARHRNRPIIPIVLEGEYIYNTKTGKYDIDYWSDLPDELNDIRAQFLFYEGVGSIQRLEAAIQYFHDHPQRNIDWPRPPDPRPTAEATNNTAALYDSACDFALRMDFVTANRIFQRVMNMNDPDFSIDSHDWIVILRDYQQMVSWDERANTRYRIQVKWESYVAQFPKTFISMFDPRGFQSRFNGTPNRAPVNVVASPVIVVTQPPAQPKPRLSPSHERQRLLAIMLDPNRPPTERAEAGREINRYGDPRPGVCDFDFRVGDYWCEVPAGEFTIGRDKDWDNPVRKVTLPKFYIAKYQVTYKQFQAFLDDQYGFANRNWWQGLDLGGLIQQHSGHGKQKWKFDNHPRENVSWFESIAFCRWLSEDLGYQVSLPTEEQWEKAARGTDRREYPWGNGYLLGHANMNESDLKGVTSYLQQTTAVGIYPNGISSYGALDMSGNVWEWILTGYRNPSSRKINVYMNHGSRGGSWREPPDLVHTALQASTKQDERNSALGLRLVCTDPLPPRG